MDRNKAAMYMSDGFRVHHLTSGYIFSFDKVLDIIKDSDGNDVTFEFWNNENFKDGWELKLN
jgi:hypothetical protein